MAVSASTDFNQTGTELVQDALAELGVHQAEEPLAAVELAAGLRALTRMFLAWETQGIGGWTYTEGSLTLADSDGSYSFASGGDFVTVPFDIMQVRVSHDGGNEIEMMRLSREEYYRLPNRTVEGFPTQFFYDRQRDSGTLYIWPEPDDALYDLTFTYRRRIMDMDASADNFDLPPEWHEAIVFGLANRLVGRYGMAGKPAAARVQMMAERAYQQVLSFDIAEGNGSVSILPAYM